MTVAAGVAALTALALGLVALVLPVSSQWFDACVFVAGLCVFAVAMRWDLSDPLRQTQRSDVAFWLHLIAAPMLIKPAFSAVSELGSGLAEATLVIAAYVAIGVVALAIDRRAIGPDPR